METRVEREGDVDASLFKDKAGNEGDNEVPRVGLASWDKRKRRVIAQFCFFMMEFECWRDRASRNRGF